MEKQELISQIEKGYMRLCVDVCNSIELAILDFYQNLYILLIS